MQALHFGTGFVKTLLICHSEDLLTRESMARWLASFSDLVGIVLIEEPRRRLRKRVRREFERIGPLRFLDVLAWRLYNHLVLSKRDRQFETAALERIRERYPPIPDGTAALRTTSPNSMRALRFIRRHQPDVIVARCKSLLREEVFSVPAHGAWVMHPGVCPEYRNAHGCFWALANGDHERVGMTLLRIDAGIDTGPVYGYYSYDIDQVNDTPAMINHRVVLDNLDALQRRFEEIVSGEAAPIDTEGRDSAEWGQPWLSRYLRWKWRARRPLKAVGLCYHDAVENGALDTSGFPGASAGSYKLDAEQLQQHLDALHKRRPEGATRVDHLHKQYHPNPLLLTFDDGGVSAMRIAELLEQKDWRGHFLITAGKIGAPGFLSAEQIRELHERGHIIGSHSWSHPERMSHCDDDTLCEEWQRSVERLSDVTGAPVETASVPGGFHSRRVAEAAAAAGIRMLFTSEPRKRVEQVNDCLVLGRYSIHRRTSPATAAALGAAEPTIAQAWQYVFWNTKKLLKTVGGNAWLAAREAWWRRASGVKGER